MGIVRTARTAGGKVAVRRETTAKRLTPTVTLNISEKSDFRVGKKSVKKHVSQVVQLPSLEN